MKTTKEYINILRSYKLTKSAEYGIIGIGIFGSVARNTHTKHSDIDICVELSHPSLFKMVHIREDLQQLFGTNVDIIRIHPNMDEVLKHDIEKECINV